MATKTNHFDQLFEQLKLCVGTQGEERPHPNLDPDEHFTALVVAAQCTGSLDDGFDALTGQSSEKGLDAILVNREAETISVFQSKYRRSRGKAEPSGAITEFVTNVRHLLADEDLFTSLLEGMEPRAAEKARQSRLLLRDSGYALHLYFVTPWRISSPVKNKATREARRSGDGAFSECKPSLTFIDDQDLLRLFEEWQLGASPPVPKVKLEILEHLKTRPSSHGVHTYVCSVRGDYVAELFERFGASLFHQNIRGFLGSSKVNASIRETIRKRPEEFWFLNNGLTILCASAKFDEEGDKRSVNLDRPQIINGQQTTRCLAEEIRHAGKTHVLVRILDLKHEESHTSSSTALVERIVEATNSQNPVTKADLRSNDPIQVAIERSLKDRYYWYERKRGELGLVRPRGWRLVRRNQLVTASAIVEGFQVEQGVATLWDDPAYGKVFRADPAVLLARWRLWDEVRKEAKTLGPEQTWAKNVAFSLLAERLETKLNQYPDRVRHLIDEPLTASRARKSLRQAIRIALSEGQAFYRRESGSGPDRQDVQAFFKKSAVGKEYRAFFNRSSKAKRATFSTCLKDVRLEIGGR